MAKIAILILDQNIILQGKCSVTHFTDVITVWFYCIIYCVFAVLGSSSIIGFYSHPMNSITACMAYCMAKTGTKTVVVQSKTCACSSSKLHFKLCSHRHMNQKRLKNLLQFGFKTTLNDCLPTTSFLCNNNYFASPEIIEVKIR